MWSSFSCGKSHGSSLVAIKEAMRLLETLSVFNEENTGDDDPVNRSSVRRLCSRLRFTNVAAKQSSDDAGNCTSLLCPSNKVAGVMFASVNMFLSNSSMSFRSRFRVPDALASNCGVSAGTDAWLTVGFLVSPLTSLVATDKDCMSFFLKQSLLSTQTLFVISCIQVANTLLAFIETHFRPKRVDKLSHADIPWCRLERISFPVQDGQMLQLAQIRP